MEIIAIFVLGLSALVLILGFGALAFLEIKDLIERREKNYGKN